jgi:hypothetical protein
MGAPPSMRTPMTWSSRSKIRYDEKRIFAEPLIFKEQ